jgi:hypothetical protein
MPASQEKVSLLLSMIRAPEPWAAARLPERNPGKASYLLQESAEYRVSALPGLQEQEPRETRATLPTPAWEKQGAARLPEGPEIPDSRLVPAEPVEPASASESVLPA